MKVLTFLILLFAILREIRPQLPIFYPSSLSLSLANEEFIQPVEEIKGEEETPPPPPQTTQKEGGVEDGGGGTATNSEGVVIVLNKNKTEGVEGGGGGEIAWQQDSNVNVTQVNNTGNVTSTNGSQPLETQTQTPSTGVPSSEPEGKRKWEEQEEPIPSYMEWAQKKQLELITNNLAAKSQNNGVAAGGTIPNGGASSAQGQQNGQGSGSTTGGRNLSAASSSPSAIDAKNFASPDCGAKVVQSNAEAQNPSGVLSSSQDEYMLNKCGTSIWFVIELCEPLTVERISLGNLELFSSSPKEVEFGISDRYPTRDWVKLGPFTLPDARAIHPIVLPATNASTFGKFLKVSVLNHYGSEHYCPISVVRVNGKSEYEVLERETTHHEDGPKEGGALYEEPIEDESFTTEEAGKSGGIKDTVMSIINKAVQSIVRRGSPTGEKGSSENEALLKSKCQSVLQCVPSGPLTQDIYKLLSCNSTKLLSFLASNSPWCGWDYCHATFESRSIGLPWQPEGFYASLFGGPSVLEALCHYVKPRTDGCDPACLAVNGTLKVLEFSNESLTGDNATVVGGANFNSDQQINPLLPLSPDDHVVDEQQPPTPNPGGTVDSSATTMSPSEQKQQLEVLPQDNDSSEPDSQPNTVNAKPQAQKLPPQEAQIPAPPPAQPEESNNQFQIPSGNQGQPQQKESVFVRLTNRIKNLERNQSLTASYLDELSKRFKKQGEDNAAAAESTKKLANETRIRMLQLDEFYRQEVQSLRRNLEDVRERLFSVHLQRSLLVILCLSQTILVIVVVVWVRRKIAQVQNQMDATLHHEARRLSAAEPKDEHEVKRRESDPVVIVERRPILIRKRSNSDTIPNDKAKRIRKRNKKQMNSNDEIEVRMSKSQSANGLVKLAGGIQSTSNIKPQPASAPLTPKENIDPHFRTNPPIPSSDANSVLQSRNAHDLPQLSSRSFLPPSSFKVDDSSPFTFHSQFSDSGISTSSRFALLASPTRNSPPSGRNVSPSRYFNPPISYNRNGSTESTASTTSSGTPSGGSDSLSVGSISSSNMANGHGENPAPSPSGLKQKAKKGGLKALMPKIFDR